MSDIRNQIKAFSDEYLLEQFNTKKQEYTSEAITAMEEEIASRNLNFKDTVLSSTQDSEVDEAAYSKLLQEEFGRLEHLFNQTDITIAVQLLKEQHIPLYVESSQTSGILPVESEATAGFAVFVPKSVIEKAERCLEQLFNKADGRYVVQYANSKERLKAFSFHDMPFSEKQMQEEIEVQFSAEETSSIQTLLQRLVNEAEAIEERTGQLLFYYDNVGDCLERLSRKQQHYSRSDLLTILETLQVFCDEETFPVILDSTIDALLNFFIIKQI